MSWTKTANVAMLGDANWDGFIRKVPNSSPQQAKRISIKNPKINFFFFCREHSKLGDKGEFDPGDAVFFRGKPSFGSAPQCDSYQKNQMTIVYISPVSSQQFRDIASYTSADGSPAVDVVCIFGGNYCTKEYPCLRAENNNPPTDKPLNPNIQEVLEDGSVKFLQDKGITVLLTILNGHSLVGWSQFTNEIDATDFVNYLKTDMVDKYGLDGIDIDDEYSNGKAIATSLVMVTSIMKRIMPDKIISKALFKDGQYFIPSVDGKRLSDTLDYGWEMTYEASPKHVLPPYVKYGMSKSVVSKGFYYKLPSYDPMGDVQWIKKNGFGGVMMFNCEDPHSVEFMGKLVDALYGPGNWNYN